ncbi:CsbD family protein [Nocardioides gilvus]|uniref:CsbD family protein n=1 Tax=Nocardioides gilvus TaxID=1735589 RepID=UPI000D74C2B2|nr:CsbD family protein [Nocardioides gilvus]
MGLNDRIENKTEDLTGRGKEAVGAATDDDSLKNEGKADQTKAGVKDKVQDAKDKVSQKLGDL